MNLPHFVLYNYPASMVVTFVSSALVPKGFLTQETCVSVGEKNPSKQKKPQPMRRLSSGMFVNLKK